jgi:hypothetical protein
LTNKYVSHTGKGDLKMVIDTIYVFKAFHFIDTNGQLADGYPHPNSVADNYKVFIQLDPNPLPLMSKNIE